MDTLLLNTKRKKRKTRKCLDELRKRSRSTSVTGDPSNKILPQVCEFSNLIGAKQSNNCITSKRLTLTMFTKAVRSETITRPLLCDAKQDSNLNMNLKSPVISPLNIMVNPKSSDESTPKICNDSDIPRQSELENFRHDSENSSDSMILFSPMQKEENRTFRESANEETISTITSTSRSVEDLGYQLYEELIEDIPLHLRRILPNLIKEDVLNKTKTSLQNVYFENLQKQYEPPKSDESCVKQNGLISDRSCTTNEIVQNPMDYIKIGWRQRYQHSYHESSASNADISLPQTPHTLCSPLVSPQLHSVLSYTPDYEYYPHRLNE